jgi:hypothetical protein
MSTPDVLITQLDGALGILPPSAGKMLALCGCSSSGTVATPAAYARISDVQAAFGSGPMVEAAAYAIERYGKPVILCRATSSTAGTQGTIDVTGVVGTSVVSNGGSPAADDDYEVKVVITTGGTRGTAGIVYKYSLDGGRTYSQLTALGTDLTITIPNSGGVNFALAAGTLLAGDTWGERTTAPAPDATALGVGLDALRASNLSWEFVYIATPITAALLSTIDAKLSSMSSIGRYRWALGNTRVPNIGESESSYKTALDTIFSSLSQKSTSLWAGGTKTLSSISYRQYKRPLALSIAALQANVSEEINIAAIDEGPLPGVSIRDANGNPDEHDESINPGLDDSRFGTARTWNGVEGVYPTWPRIFAPTGSDFQIIPYRRVMNLFCETVRDYMLHRVAKPIRVDKVTGFILEADALEIESGVLARLRTVLLQKPKASDVQFVLSRTDNLLSTMTLTGDGRLVPLAYPKFISITLGFNNPALRAVTV